MTGPLRQQLADLRVRLRNSRAYEYYRGFASARQRAAFQELLARVNALPPDVELDSWIHDELRTRSAGRKPLPATIEHTTIVGVGARGWERHGLWPTFE